MLRLCLLISLLVTPQFATSKVASRTVTLEWNEVPGSQGFELEFRRVLKSGKLKAPIFFKNRTTNWSGSILPGKYQFRIRSKDDRDVWGEWSEPTEYWVRLSAPPTLTPPSESIIKSENSENEKVKFEWASVEGSQAYWIEIETVGGLTLTQQRVEKNQFEMELKVAENYQWRVTALMDDDTVTDESRSQWSSFTIQGGQLKAPRLIRPESAFVEAISWEPTPFASSYDLLIERQLENKKWKVLKKFNQLTGNSQNVDPQFPGGRWRARMIAKAPLRITSPQDQIEFDVYDGLRTPEAIEEAKNRAAIEQARDHYLIASYLITSLDYNAKFADLPGLSTHLNAISGTGRIGYSHFVRKSPWGLVAIADMGGVIINSQNHTFASAELTGIWRTYYRGITQLRLYSGLSYRERPRAKGSTSQNVDVQNVSTGDFTFGGQIWQPLTSTLGIQLNGQFLYNVSGFSVPDGGTLSPQLSFQIGSMASYKFRENITCLAGYAYRRETLQYKNVSGKNTIETTGHYLNLYLEWGFH